MRTAVSRISRSLTNRAAVAVAASVLVSASVQVVSVATSPVQATPGAKPRVQQTASVPVEPVAATESDFDPAASADAPRASWPARVTDQAVAAGRGSAKLGSAPIWISPAPGSTTRPGVSVSTEKLSKSRGLLLTIEAESSDESTSGTGGGGLRSEAPFGVTAAKTDAVSASRSQGAAVTVDFSKFAEAGGGDWATRLRYVDVTDGRNVELPTEIDEEEQTATTTLRSSSLAAGTMQVALAAGASGSSGDFAATSLAPSASWQVGVQTGDFSWSYPLRTPPAVNGPQPSLAITYSSGSVDGRTMATNNQTSVVGEGFGFDNGYIERKFVSCADDMDGTNAGRKTSDLCWRDDNASLVLAGHSTDLVHDPQTGWHLKDADGSTIEHRVGGVNDDDNGEYWVLTTVDGTRYFFGREKWDPSDLDVTNSTLTVPVFGNQDNEPCNKASFADSACKQAWRWNLDFVVDAHDNLLTYRYLVENNRYGSRNGDEGLDYERASRLVRVEYGYRTGTRNDPVPTVVDLNYYERCIDVPEDQDYNGFNCAEKTLNEANASRWPDVPFDQICNSGACGTNYAPTFFTRFRLLDVVTKVRTGSTYTSVDKYAFEHDFPPANDGSGSSLRLYSIRHSGLVGGTKWLDPVMFTYQIFNNRVLNFPANQDAPPLNKYRLTGIRSEAGSTISVNYMDPECTDTNHPGVNNLDNNTMRCFPVWWMEPGSLEQNLHFFHKYPVRSVVEGDLGGGNPDVVTTYDYNGAPAWHFDDGELNKPKYRTWSDWRGYSKIGQTVGTGTTKTYKEFVYLRGMHGDRTTTSGQTRVERPAGNRAPQIDDVARFNGFLREETVRLNGPNGDEVSTTVNTPWLSGILGQDSTDTSRMLKVETVQTYTPLASGGVRQTRTDTSYNSEGLPKQVSDLGLNGTASDDLCTTTTYVKGALVVDKPSRVLVTEGDCATNGAIVSDTLNAYDGLAQGTAPTQGDLTKIQVRKEGGSYVTKATMQYDSIGRAVSTSNAAGDEQTVTYTPSTGHVDTITTYSPAPNGSTDPNDRWKETQFLEPAWGLPVAEVDPNGRRTDYAYDPLGQLTAAWAPTGTRASGASPAAKFSYAVSSTGRNVVTTQQLRNDNTYLTSYMFYDGLLRPRQYQMPATGVNGGRLITDLSYDARGLLIESRGPYYNSSAPSATLVAALGNYQIPAVSSTTYDGAGRQIRNDFLSYSAIKWSTTTTYGGDRITVNPPGKAPLTTTLLDGRGQVTDKIEYTSDTPASTYSDVGARTIYDYYPDGKVQRVRDGADNPATTAVDESNEWTYAYDLRGRLTSSTDPDSGLTTNEYNDLDQLTKTTHNGNVLTYSYDKAGRKTALTKDGVTQSQWVWDTLAKGQLTSSSHWSKDPAGVMREYKSEVTGYDTAYRPLGTKVTIPTGETNLNGTYTTSSTYNRDGSVASATMQALGDLPSETLLYTYDAYGQLDTLVGRAAYVADTVYAPTGEILSRDLATTIGKAVYDVRTYEEDTRRFLGSRVSRQGITEPDVNTNYTYDAAGNVTKIIDTAGTDDNQCFDYDQLGQLTRAWTSTNTGCMWSTGGASGAVAPYKVAYTYDNATGNRLTETRYNTTGIAATQRLAYPTPVGSTIRPHAPTTVTTDNVSGTDPVEAITYGGDGAIGTRKTTTGTSTVTTQTNTWDAEGHLATSTAQDGTKTTFIYDADGNRLVKRDSTGSTLYLGHSELRATTAGAKTATRFYSAGGENVAMRTAATIRFLAADHHGSVSVQIEHSNQAITSRKLLPFGGVRSNPTTALNWVGDRGFVGGQKDATTGYTHLGAREYDPGLGKFASVDPVLDTSDSRQMNGYAYGNNNPLTFSDSSGLYPTTENSNENVIATGTYGTISTTPPIPQEVATAITEWAAANTAADAAVVKLKETAKELGSIVMDELGITAGIDCFSTGDAGACAETAINVLSSAVGGLAGKILTKYGFHWKRGYEVGKKLYNLVDDLWDGFKDWRAATKVREAAASAVDAAKSAAQTFATRARDERGSFSIVPGRGGHKLSPDPDAGGYAHSTYRRAEDGTIDKYAEWTPNPRSPRGYDIAIRYDATGASHYNKVTGLDVPTPHMNGSSIPGGVREAEDWEIPK